MDKPLFGFEEYKLCYVDWGICFFTTRKLSEQWGDDWNDAPYEHNAGFPYLPLEGHDYYKDDPPPWDIYTLYYEAPILSTPADLYQPNSPWTVEHINARAHPWLIGGGVCLWSGYGIETVIQGIFMVDGKFSSVDCFDRSEDDW